MQIQPFQAVVTQRFESVVKIETVDECGNALHAAVIYQKPHGPEPGGATWLAKRDDGQSYIVILVVG